MVNLGYGVNGYVVKKYKNGKSYAKKVIKLTEEENNNMEILKINDIKYPYPRTYLELNWMKNNNHKNIPMISSINNWREIKTLQLLGTDEYDALVPEIYNIIHKKEKNKIIIKMEDYDYNLYDFIAYVNYNTGQLLDIVRQIIYLIKVVNLKYNMIHNDLHGKNIVIKKVNNYYKVSLIDFGWSICNGILFNVEKEELNFFNKYKNYIDLNYFFRFFNNEYLKFLKIYYLNKYELRDIRDILNNEKMYNKIIEENFDEIKFKKLLPFEYEKKYEYMIQNINKNFPEKIFTKFDINDIF